MDLIDKNILHYLALNARMTLSVLALKTGLSSPGASDRIKKLGQQGLIEGYTVKINPAKSGSPLLCFMEVSLNTPSYRELFLEVVKSLPEILECHHATGDFDYILKIRCRDTAHLEEIITARIKVNLPGIKTKTTIVLSTVKENFSTFEGELS